MQSCDVCTLCEWLPQKTVIHSFKQADVLVLVAWRLSKCNFSIRSASFVHPHHHHHFIAYSLWLISIRDMYTLVGLFFCTFFTWAAKNFKNSFCVYFRGKIGEKRDPKTTNRFGWLVWGVGKTWLVRWDKSWAAIGWRAGQSEAGLKLTRID